MRILIAGTVAILAATSTQAQTRNCGERTSITERLKSGYGETFAGGGLRNGESIFEVWKSDENGTWTILMTTPDGRSCVMAAGTDWHNSIPGMEQPAGIPG